ncbi:type IV pilus assembly protein PilM [Candidatus Saccharibacteria bacterium]|nr:type IV pilus assembly protein PilM [Candidatus Saccharibacteria bacterium]
MAEFVGLDIGTSTIKGVQAKAKTLVAYYQRQAAGVSMASDNQEDLKKISQSINQFFTEGKFKIRSVVTSVPESQVFTRVITLPQMGDTEIASAVQNEAQQYVPMPLDQAILDYEVLGASETQQNAVDILLVAVPKALTQKYVQVLRDAGLTPLSLETETIALSRSVVGDSSNPVMVASIGASTTDIAIFSGGALRFTRSIATGGQALERALTQSFNLEPGQAAEYIRTYGLEEKLEGKIMGAIKPVFDIIVEELKRAQAFFQSKTGRPLNRLVLVGGTANLPGVLIYLAENLGVEAARGNPWEVIAVPKGFPMDYLEEHAPSFAVAAGLALKEI